MNIDSRVIKCECGNPNCIVGLSFCTDSKEQPLLRFHDKYGQEHNIPLTKKQRIQLINWLNQSEDMTIEFEDKPETGGAYFSPCRKYRYALWRIWDSSRPLVLFIGLNPSTANETKSDPTIKSVTRIAKFNGYGGFIMMNCWAYVSTKPKNIVIDLLSHQFNNDCIKLYERECQDVVFAWGNFKIVRNTGRDQELIKMFPKAKVIGLNSNGSPKHPLLQKSNSKLKYYDPTI